ncbi:hypothetical protein PENTCL1PPCAC_25990 [Pristionchus entomophagus]|uniref:Membrane transporter n=1 Tax=Pristionchus entomophagus TaxID=358040 RepID=A0AAV5UBG6_9BILA|nr:hypothetical protein PENTCL1PPCAC_25990 [Pristionchus entomophagus]
MSSSKRTSREIEDDTSVELLPTSSEGSPIASTRPSMSSSKDVESRVSSEGRVTDWRAIYLISLINLASFVMQYTLGVNAFVYLRQIDSSSSITDQGKVKSIYRLIIGISCVLSSVYAYTRKNFRHSIIAGACMQVVGCSIYAYIEGFPEDNRTGIWIFIFGLHAAAEGCNTVLVSYVPRVSSVKDRMKAYSFLGGAEVVAVVIGPVIQFACHLLPGKTELMGISWLKISEYTVPIWICCLLSIVNLFFVTFCMEEPPLEKNPQTFCKTMAQAWQEIRNTDIPLVVVCILEKCISAFGCTTILTLAPPLIVTTFNVDESSQSFYTTMFQCVSGFLALGTVATFAKALKSSRLSSRAFLISLVFFILAYFFSIPTFSFYSQQVTVADANNTHGCNLTTYGWCDEAWIVNPWMWIVVSGGLIGVAFPLANIAHDTIYSQILGGIDQNVLTGLMVMIQNISMIPVPIAATEIFKLYGPTRWWIIVVATMIGGLVLWICSMKRLAIWTEEVER